MKTRSSKFPHIDAMTSSQLEAHLISDGISPDEYKYVMKRLKQAAKS